MPTELMGYHDSSGYRKLKVAIAGVLEKHVFGAVELETFFKFVYLVKEVLTSPFIIRSNLDFIYYP